MRGREAGEFFELPRQVVDAAKTCNVGDVGKAKVGIYQKLLNFLEAFCNNIFSSVMPSSSENSSLMESYLTWSFSESRDENLN